MKIIDNIKQMMFGKKHEFDMENPLIDDIEVSYKHSISGEIYNYTFTNYGWCCKHCNRVIWLDKEIMEMLPNKMKYGCK